MVIKGVKYFLGPDNTTRKSKNNEANKCIMFAILICMCSAVFYSLSKVRFPQEEKIRLHDKHVVRVGPVSGYTPIMLGLRRTEYKQIYNQPLGVVLL